MAKLKLSIYRLRQPLKTPYRLSFATLDAFDTLIVALENDGCRGLGEVTPLPGYSEETVESALAALNAVAAALIAGEALDKQIAALVPSDPMVASALACAQETVVEGEAAAFGEAIAGDLLLAALCDGAEPTDAAARARTLQAAGYTRLKLKAGGGDLDRDLDRIRAVAEVLDAGSAISVDANQRLSEAAAWRLCESLAELPVLLVEQPFLPTEWDAFARLAAESPVPLMLDESIWTSADIDRAAESGAKWVKLKLCKHPGMAANLALIERARSLGLKVVYGNGVQGAVGNHLEAKVYSTAGLKTAGEFNGVLKLAEDPFGSDFSVSRGRLAARGLTSVDRVLDRLTPIRNIVFTS